LLKFSTKKYLSNLRFNLGILSTSQFRLTCLPVSTPSIFDFKIFMLSPSDLLRQASTAMKQGDYFTTISILEPIVREPGRISASEANAQMMLVKAYQQNRQLESAIALCEELTTAGDLCVQDWAKQALQGLLKARAAATVKVSSEPTVDPTQPTPFRKAERAAAGFVGEQCPG
jgi:hypothetical protein